MGGRDQIIDGFLEAHGWDSKYRAPLSGDASFRRYERLEDGRRQAVLMDAPPDKEDVRPFWALSCHLHADGFSAPQVIAGDSHAGLLLLEDFGDDLFSRVVAANPRTELPLYETAVDLLVDLHEKPVPKGISFAGDSTYSMLQYTHDLLMQEAELFTDWYLPEVNGSSVPADEKSAFQKLWQDLLSQIPATDPVLVLRDYHADNLIWLPDRTGIARVGLLDFQDAVAGHPAYDLVSLLEDARRDVSEALAEAMIERYMAAMCARSTSFDIDAFRTAYAILGAQRNTKIIGIFSRLWRRDRKPVYLELIPRVWELLERDLEHPALSEIKHWYNDQVPLSVRTTPLEAV